MLTLDDWLPVVHPHLRDTMVGPQALSRLRGLACRLPGDSLAALEIRLAPRRRVVDLAIRLLRPSAAAEPLVPPLALELLSGESPVSSLWLEYDLHGAAGAPILCAGLQSEPDAAWLTGTLLPLLHGAPLATSQERLVHRCLAEIPAPGRLLYVFSLRPRGEGAVRLEIVGLDPAAVLEFLERLAPVPAVRSAAAVLPLFEGVERLHLSFDLTEEIAPRIGIEGSFVRLPHHEPRWAELFVRLVDRGLCAPEKRDAALAWPGVDSFRSALERWPAGAGPGTACVRSLSHVKVVACPGRRPEAKVYLLITPLKRLV